MLFRSREALVLIDELLTRQRRSEFFFQRARAGAIAGDKKLAWAALEHIARSRYITPRLAKRSLSLARSLGVPPEGSDLIARLNQALRPRRDRKSR